MPAQVPIHLSLPTMSFSDETLLVLLLVLLQESLKRILAWNCISVGSEEFADFGDSAVLISLRPFAARSDLVGFGSFQGRDGLEGLPVVIIRNPKANFQPSAGTRILSSF